MQYINLSSITWDLSATIFPFPIESLHKKFCTHGMWTIHTKVTFLCPTCSQKDQWANMKSEVERKAK